MVTGIPDAFPLLIFIKVSECTSNVMDFGCLTRKDIPEVALAINQGTCDR